MAKKNKNRIRSKLLVFLYALSIAGLGLIFLLQSSGSQVVKNQNKATSIISADKKQNTNIADTIFAPPEPVYTYDIIDKNPNPKIQLGESATLTLKVRNTGNQIWNASGDDIAYLGANRPADRETVFYKDGNRGWFSGNRIMMDKKIVKPSQVVNFTFQITAPNKSGIYREFFTPIIEKIKWLEDKNIYWDIEVRDPNKPDEELKITLSGGPLKYINLKLGAQRLYAYENGLVKYNFITSTGREGADTPTGKFAIYNKYATAYSKLYDLYMDNWMAITPDGLYGVHSLPYWLLKNGGKLYEGEDHLGTKVSNGCIRLSVEESKILYDWAEVGIPVIIEN